jgi:hypothetical protein
VEALKGTALAWKRRSEPARENWEDPTKNQGKPRNNPGKHQENTRENQDLLTQLNITYITEPSNEPIDHQHQSSKYERKAPSAGGGINQRNKPTKRRKNG